MSDDAGIRVASLITDLMNKGFDDTANSVVQAITDTSFKGVINKRLTELAERAQLLAESNKVLTVDDMAMRALLADMDDVIEENIDRIRLTGGALTDNGLNNGQLANQQLSLLGVSEADRVIVSANWTSVDPEVMRELVSTIDNPAWTAQLDDYGDEIITKIKRQITIGQTAGWGPIRMANEITRVIQGVPGGRGFPESQAENLMRTLQMQTFRTAQTINRVQNADILDGHIRIAALDDRTCLSCISLHGEVFPVERRIDDHHQGRCTSIPLVTGYPNFVPSGQDWWDERTPEQQLAQAGTANMNAMNAGAVTLPDYRHPYVDPVFGDMIRQSSLTDVLGEGAKRYYARNQN